MYSIVSLVPRKATLQKSSKLPYLSLRSSALLLRKLSTNSCSSTACCSCSWDNCCVKSETEPKKPVRLLHRPALTSLVIYFKKLDLMTIAFVYSDFRPQLINFGIRASLRHFSYIFVPINTGYFTIWQSVTGYSYCFTRTSVKSSFCACLCPSRIWAKKRSWLR